MSVPKLMPMIFSDLKGFSVFLKNPLEKPNNELVES